MILLAIMPESMGLLAISPLPADASILPLASSSFTWLWGEPYALLAALFAFPLLTGILLRYAGIKYTALVGVLLGLGSYAVLQSQVRQLLEGQSMDFSLAYALLLTASLVVLSITSFSGMVQLGAQSTAARRLFSISALSLLIPILYFLAQLSGECFEWGIQRIIYAVFLLPLALWLLKSCFTLKGYDLTLDSRDTQQARYSGSLLCRLIALLSPLMLYNLQIILMLNLLKYVSGLFNKIESPLVSHFAVLGAFFVLLFVLRSIGTIILKKRGRLSIALALLTANLAPVKLADFVALRKHPIFYPCLLVSFSLLLWYALVLWAGSIHFFYLF